MTEAHTSPDIFVEPPLEIESVQIEASKGRMWQVKAWHRVVIRHREILAIQELLRQLKCNPAMSEHYRPHKTDESKIVFVG